MCITVKNRGAALLRCIESLKRVGVDEICIADWHSDDIDIHEISGIKYVQLEGDFSIGRGKNEAAKLATSDSIFFLDADITVGLEAISMAIRVCQMGLVYIPIMYMEMQGWGIHSFGQVALLKSIWNRCMPWPEWTSYGGEDNIFVHQFGQGFVRDLQYGLLHHWHEHDLRNKYYKNPTGHDLDIWNRENKWGKYAKE